MNCSSCGVNIPPSFLSALEANRCPACGDQIMTQESKELLEELTTAISQMPNDARGIASWLLNNYRFKKIGDAEPLQAIHRPNSVPTAHGEGGLKHAPSVVDEYMKRTEMSGRVENAMAAAKRHRNKSDHFAALMANAPDPYGLDTPEDSGEASEEDVAAYQEMMRGGINPFGGKNAKGGAALTADQIMSMQKTAAPSSDGVDRSTVGYNDDPRFEGEELSQLKTQEGKNVLFENRLKRIKAQDALENGVNNINGFRRG